MLMRIFLLIVVYSLSVSARAQVAQHDQAECRPSAAPSHAAVVELYMSLAELPLDEQRQQMWALSSDTRAALWAHNVKRYLLERPYIAADTSILIESGIAMIKTPAWFDIQKDSFGFAAKSQALAAFKRAVQEQLSPDAIYEVFIRLGPEPEATAKPVLSPSQGTQGAPPVQSDFFHKCTCGGWLDCGSRDDRDCFEAYCQYTKSHCGWFNDEPCWGVCKATQSTVP